MKGEPLRPRELAALAALALALRALHLFALSRSPLYPYLLGDAAGYDAWARRLAAGDWIGSEVFYQAPLYAYFLGALYAVAGDGWWIPRLAQSALGAAACALLASATALAFGRRAGLAAGALFAGFAPAIFFDGLLQKSALDAFAIALLLRLLTALPERRPAAALALGATGGALVLLRENALPLLALLWIWLGVRAPERGAARRSVLAFALGSALLLAPVAVRNYALSGELHLTTSQFGPNFYLGNHARARGSYEPLRPGRGSFVHEREDAIALAERALGRRLGPGEVSDYWLRRALADIAADPLRWLRLLGTKTALLLHAQEQVDSEDLYTAAEWSPVLAALLRVAHFGTLLPLALFGAWSCRQRLRELWVLPALALGYAASVLLFYVFARYRFPLVPLLIPLAGAGAAAAPGWLRDSAARERCAVAAALLLLTSLANWPLAGALEMRAVTWYNLGNAQRSAREPQLASESYRRALEGMPGLVDARHNLAELLGSEGHIDAAEALYRENLALAPEHAPSHNNLANLLLARGARDEALLHYRSAVRAEPEDRASRHNLARALRDGGQPAEAVALYRELLAERDDDLAARFDLAQSLSRLGADAEAASELERCLELQPRWPQALGELAGLRLRDPSATQATREAAVALARRAVEQSSGRDPRALAVLARAQLASGDRDTAVTTLREALAQLRGDPELRRQLRGELRELGAAPLRRAPAPQSVPR